MALPFLQQVLVCSLLVLFLGLLVPKMMGGDRSGRAPGARLQQPSSTAGSGKGLHNSDFAGQPYESMQKTKKTIEQELKSKRTEGSGRGLTFTLMPVYAIGVGIFAAYKLIKSEQERSSKKEKKAEVKKAKETENQLMALEQHLAQTEVMLNSLLMQLDPLSNCVNALAMGQREEIMTQLQSIRTLMKEIGIDKPSHNIKDENNTCNHKLEDLIQSFGQQHKKKENNEDTYCSAGNGEDDWSDTYHIREEEADQKDSDRLFADQLPDLEILGLKETIIHSNEFDKEKIGLRKRNIIE
ncbi:resistance to inhibitors of cholinesterase protein 3-like isoform X2 [Ambystoma mexicanum]|uniref:resistance to inhibitors of cholinesterase protein 3-like isoform X2 n=1 Tax=Ambystoma mexicanum TaxID=8296 RepID=UPI0037E9AAD7